MLLSQFYLKFMIIKIQIPDAVYASLLKENTRVKGSIALVSPREGNFNVYSKPKNPASRREYRKLPHGRVSLSSESLRLTLNIGLDETGICPSQILVEESEMASYYVNRMFVGNFQNDI